MSADKTADAIKLNLRLPKHLHKRLKQQARRNNVSLNTEIVNLLEGAETETAKRITEFIKPTLDEAIREAMIEAVEMAASRTTRQAREQAGRMAAYRTTRQAREQAGRLLDTIINDPARPVRTEAELADRLRGWNPRDAKYFMQVYRDRKAEQK